MSSVGKGHGVLYKLQQRKNEERERLRGGRDSIKFSDIRFERWQIVGLSEWCWGRAMVAYTKPQQRKRDESKRLRGERDTEEELQFFICIDPISYSNQLNLLKHIRYCHEWTQGPVPIDIGVREEAINSLLRTMDWYDVSECNRLHVTLNLISLSLFDGYYLMIWILNSGRGSYHQVSDEIKSVL